MPRRLRKPEFERRLRALFMRHPRDYVIFVLGAKKARGKRVVTPLVYGSHPALAALAGNTSVQAALAEAVQAAVERWRLRDGLQADELARTRARAPVGDDPRIADLARTHAAELAAVTGQPRLFR